MCRARAASRDSRRSYRFGSCTPIVMQVTKDPQTGEALSIWCEDDPHEANLALRLFRPDEAVQVLREGRGWRMVQAPEALTAEDRKKIERGAAQELRLVGSIVSL